MISLGPIVKQMPAILPDTVISGRLNKAERRAIVDYAECSFYCNTSLRRGVQAMPIVDAIDAALAKSTIVKPMVVYRGISHLPREGLGLLGPGEILKDDAFLSTTRLYRTAIKFAQSSIKFTKVHVVLSISVDAGQPAIDVGKIATHYAKESEILFPKRQALQLVSVRESFFYTKPEFPAFSWDENPLCKLYSVKAQMIAPNFRDR